MVWLGKPNHSLEIRTKFCERSKYFKTGNRGKKKDLIKPRALPGLSLLLFISHKLPFDLRIYSSTVFTRILVSFFSHALLQEIELLNLPHALWLEYAFTTMLSL